MDYLFLKDFLVSYSLPTLIVAGISCIVRLIFDKFFSNLPKVIKSYIPFFSAIIFYFAYEIIFVLKQVYFTKEAFYGGILSGSLSAIFYSTISKICKGKPVGTNATLLLIEGILNGYIAQDLLTKTALEIEKVLSIEDGTLIEQQVVDTLTYNCSELSSAEIVHLARLILGAVKSVEKT